MAYISQSFLFWSTLLCCQWYCQLRLGVCVWGKTKDFVHTTFQHHFSFFHRGQGGDVPVFFGRAMEYSVGIKVRLMGQ